MRAFVNVVALSAFSLALTTGGYAQATEGTGGRNVSNGRQIFARSCGGCHDTHSSIRRAGPGLKSYYRNHQPRPTDAQVRALISRGKGAMPGFSSFTRGQTDDLIAYLKTL
jgi:mono/diheme cytochrome c family protein